MAALVVTLVGGTTVLASGLGKQMQANLQAVMQQIQMKEKKLSPTAYPVKKMETTKVIELNTKENKDPTSNKEHPIMKTLDNAPSNARIAANMEKQIIKLEARMRCLNLATNPEKLTDVDAKKLSDILYRCTKNDLQEVRTTVKELKPLNMELKPKTEPRPAVESTNVQP